MPVYLGVRIVGEDFLLRSSFHLFTSMCKISSCSLPRAERIVEQTASEATMNALLNVYSAVIVFVFITVAKRTSLG